MPSENTSLNTSLNYLNAQKFFAVTEVIASQNSGFVLIGGNNASVSICSASAATMAPLKTL
jgi:hypothetical protein